MNTQFDGIAEFVAAAKLGSFTAAAAQLGVTKSAVGRAVSRLEIRLDAKLFRSARTGGQGPDRSPQRIRPIVRCAVAARFGGTISRVDA
jgi:DNA-binding transcriptional LysR family regulator